MALYLGKQTLLIMHLGIVRQRYNPFGGAERVIQRILSSLNNSGLLSKVTVLSSGWPDLGSNPGDSPAFDFVRSKVNPRGIGRFQRQKYFLSDVLERIKQNPSIDVLQAHERLPGCDIFRAGDGVHRAWLTRLQREGGWFSNYFLNLDPYHKLVCKNEMEMARDPNTVFVANSPLTQREIQEFLGVPDHRVFTIPNSIDVHKWGSISRTEASRVKAKKELSLDPEKPCVLFVGSGFNRKGLAPLIRAIGMSYDLQLLVLGADRSANRFKAIAQRLAAGRVFFAGESSPFGLPLTAADVFCLPSLYDSFPNASLEAIAAAVPAIVTRDTGLADFISTGGGGTICTRDPESILASIRYCLANNHNLSKEAHSLAQTFSHDRLARKWIDLYDRVAEAKAHR